MEMTREEVREVIRKLKVVNQLDYSGNDYIYGRSGNPRIKELKNASTKDGRVPGAWNKEVIILIHKEGDRMECCNVEG